MTLPGIIVLATRNAHKAAEIQTILGERFRLLSLKDFPGAPTVVEDATTFAGNATKKALELAGWLAGQPDKFECPGPESRVLVLADDSGLEVDALNGAPGVHSARFAALDSGKPGNSPDAENRAKLLRLLEEVRPEQRTARFRCVLALAPVIGPGPQTTSPVCYADEMEIEMRLFDGACEGTITFAPRGEGGFGYDPLFIPTGQRKTFAELGEEVKNQLSHRAKALEKLKEHLKVLATDEPG